jgi:hypothetical protein
MNKMSPRLTPINDNDPECDKTHVTLCIYNIDPDLVTARLGIIPTICSKIGVERTMPNGSKQIGNINNWLLSSISWFSSIPDPVSSKDIRTHLDWLLNKVEPSTSQLLELQELPDAKIVIRCSWWSAQKDGGCFTLWPEQMENLAKMNLECDFSISYYGD